jgi:cholesterol oxidase
MELRGRRHRLHASWDVSSNEPLYTAEHAVSANVVRARGRGQRPMRYGAAGGKPFVTPTWGLFRQPVTVHNLGGTRMGPIRRSPFCDPDGEVFRHPGVGP